MVVETKPLEDCTVSLPTASKSAGMRMRELYGCDLGVAHQSELLRTRSFNLLNSPVLA